MGWAFASNLIGDENSGGATWWGTQFPDQSAEEIEGILADFMGLHTYVRMENLPFDGIHHIDMHMKLLDEETILMAEYPAGVADGPQIEANLEYVLSNHTSKWGTPFDVVRIPSPPEPGWGGGFPDEGGNYMTYTNSVFVNNTILLPTYYEEYRHHCHRHLRARTSRIQRGGHRLQPNHLGQWCHPLHHPQCGRGRPFADQPPAAG